MAVELGIARQEVIGAHNGGVAPHVAAAQIALFQDRDIGDPVALGQIIGGRETMTTATDDDHIILGLGRCIPPMRLPALVAGQAFFQNPQAGKPHATPLAPMCAPIWRD